MRGVFINVIIFVVIVSCKTDEENGSFVNGVTNQIINHDGSDREYIQYIPSDYDGSEKLPLLINFHGFGGQARGHMQAADLRSLAESNGFVLVYPQGSDLNGFSHWNAALKGGDTKSDVDDLGFIEALINKLISQNLIDDKRVYAIGYSNGGMMSYALGCYKSNLIAAIGSVSGYMLQNDCTPSHSIPLIKLHGTNDYYDGGGVYNSVEFVVNFWKNFNNISADPLIDSYNDNGMLIEKYSYRNDSNILVEHYKVNDGDHVWFDFNYKGKKTNEIIWDFFSQFDIEGYRN